MESKIVHVSTPYVKFEDGTILDIRNGTILTNKK